MAKRFVETSAKNFATENSVIFAKIFVIFLKRKQTISQT
jgi:hypothetical protein